MAHRLGPTLARIFAFTLLCTPVLAREAATQGQPVTFKAAAVAYKDINVPGFPPGLKSAVLDGDPTKEGLYTMRLQFPDGYEYPPHWHPADVHVTIVSGVFYFGMGEKANQAAAQAYQSGDYVIEPARMAHFGHVKGETIVQLHGMGPFQINVVGQ